jgi:hypothetical protein
MRKNNLVRTGICIPKELYAAIRSLEPSDVSFSSIVRKALFEHYHNLVTAPPIVDVSEIEKFIDNNWGG